jgi:hypothetical protein
VPTYVSRIDEIVWGIALVAVTMIMHGVGMLLTLRVSYTLKPWRDGATRLFPGLASIIIASWMIILVHLTEVMLWATFLMWKGAIPSAGLSLYFYFSLNEYTTLGSSYDLDRRWRLLEGMLATAGLLSFAWSTGVLLTLAQDFQDRQLQLFKNRKAKRRSARAAPPPHPRVDSVS